MSRKLKVIIILGLASIVAFQFRDGIKPALESLPFSIPFLNEKVENDSKPDEDKGSYKYYFKDYHDDKIGDKIVTDDNKWCVYEAK